MPDIRVGAQIFDIAFHPTESLVYTGLLSGEVKAFSYDEQGNHECKFSVRPSKRSCRAIAVGHDGGKLWAGGKGKALHTIDVATGVVADTRAAAHAAAINRMKPLLPHLLATGDDDGVIKLWDPRKPDAIRAYAQHFDFISDFLFLEDKKQLVTTSGDGTLSVIDVRSKKTEPIAHSEDQEDELLSIVPIKGGQKFVVGTQLGILSIFNRKSGWGDCVDRIPGHPHSVDALCALPSRYPSAQSTVLTGSSDGLMRAVQLFPTKLLGVVADHGDFPVERIAIDQNGEGRWVGSAGHEEVLKLTDLNEIFEDEDDEDEDEKSNGGSEEDSDEGSGDEEDKATAAREDAKREDPDEEEDSDKDEVKEEDEADSSDEEPQQKKRKRKKEQDPLQAMKKRKGRNEVDAEPSFFADL
ncbi:WD40 repeat-like protein [Obba rivulosa]|uniref:WD repeat-containing protein JIP5 n=1 Tax=Obba rivulosa TaxID=1052685 RepID=A0A8E2J6U1_9APHY|nr:WD40 repeat-like protein [Obba rivulosa]